MYTFSEFLEEPGRTAEGAEERGNSKHSSVYFPKPTRAPAAQTPERCRHSPGGIK